MRNTGKQRKKRSREKDIIIPRRILSVIMALVLCVGLYPAWAYAEESVSGPCVHHRPHTRDCGYKEAEPGHECAHVHTEDCYRTVEEEDGSTAERLDCHHEHDDTCGYIPESEDGEGSPCTYECRICSVEELIAALPDAADIRSDNADGVQAQLEEILALYRELTEDEQGEIDLSRCYALQEVLDGANDPDPVAGEVSVDYQEAAWDGSSSKVTYATKTAENCTVVADSAGAVTWTAGWYAVNGSVTISEPVTVSGAVNLILTDGCVLNAEKGIVVTTGNSLAIYAQSENGGTLNATGASVIDGQNYIYYVAAGIGGSTTSFDSGSITIHGGIINATGGVANNNFGNPNFGGAGIGGGSTDYGKGGDSGAVTIYGGTITADSGEGNVTGAGIGGGGGKNGGSANSITIYGGSITATSHSDNTGGAGIGGGSGQTNGGTGNITIHGGTVRAAGSEKGAGIGGGGGGINYASGSGTVNISGGTVTAVGGKCAAGIGGGGGYSVEFMGNTNTCTGGTGSVTITGGIVDAKGGEGNASGDYAGNPIGNGGNASGTATVTKTTGIVFENGAGTVYGDVTLDGNYAVPAGYSLHIPAGASLSGSGNLSGGGTFITENLTEDMVSVPDDLYFNGQDRTGEIAARAGALICRRFFAVSGWTVAVTKTDDLTYTVTYTNDSDGTKFLKTVKLRQSDSNQGNQGQTGGSDGKNDGQSSGSGSTDPCSGNTVLQNPLMPPADTGIDPGKEAAPEKPGAGIMPVNAGGGNTAGRRTASDRAADPTERGIKQPFIKGADGKIGWDVIRAEEEQAQEGSTINVDMNGSVAVPRDIFDRIKGKDITVTFDMGGGILWSVDGKSVTGDTSPDSAGDIDFSVKTGVNTVPVDIVNNVTGERYNIQISLAFEGEFGFTAVLSIDLGRENAGYTANLYYYNKSAGELEWICKDRIAEDGTVSLAFTHASDYVIAIDGDGEEGDSAVESAQADEKGRTAGNGTATEKNPQEGQPWGMWLMVVIGVAVIVVGAGVFFMARKKKDKGNE